MKTGMILIGMAVVLASAVVGGAFGGDIQGNEQGAAQSEVCEHVIKRADCPFCTPSLVESRGFCSEHGVPEALCVKCHPYLETVFKAKSDWCTAHNVPESQCTICNPKAVTAASGSVVKQEAAARRSQLAPNARCTKTKTLVRLSSADITRTAGLDFVTVEKQQITQTIKRNAEIAYTGTRYARLASRAPGVVSEIRTDLGNPVSAGDVVAVVDSMDLGTAKAEVLRAIETVNLWEANAKRERSLVDRGIGTEREALGSETKLAESRIDLSKTRQRLRNLGLSHEQIEATERDRDTSSLLPLLAPFDGMVVERTAVVGEVVEPRSPFLAVADTKIMWAMIDLFAEDLVSVTNGQEVALVVDGLRGESFSGRITWISTQLDSRTRTLKARAELDNADGLLRAGMFGQVNIVGRSEEPAVAVPKEAVQWDGCCNVVFVKANDDGTVFQPKQVRLGYEAPDFYEVRSGLEPGEAVVTRGSFLLKTEILKGAIGAGCCAVEHLKK